MPTTRCKMCDKDVMMDLTYHGPGRAGFDYSCGCSSDHYADKTIWTTEDGRKKVILTNHEQDEEK